MPTQLKFAELLSNLPTQLKLAELHSNLPTQQKFAELHSNLPTHIQNKHVIAGDPRVITPMVKNDLITLIFFSFSFELICEFGQSTAICRLN